MQNRNNDSMISSEKISSFRVLNQEIRNLLAERNMFVDTLFVKKIKIGWGLKKFYFSGNCLTDIKW